LWAAGFSFTPKALASFAGMSPETMPLSMLLFTSYADLRS